MRLQEFKSLVKGLEKPDNWGYKYTYGNSEYRSQYWQSRTADYHFCLINSVTMEEIEIQKGRTKQDHFEHEQHLIRKYASWAKKAFKQ